MKWLSQIFLAVVLFCSASAASAANAYTQGVVHMRAGPSTDYPIVLSVPPGSLLQVNGCLDDFTWCDADWEGNHGWVYGNYLYYDYQDRRVPVLQFGAALGIGVVSFSLGDYWGRYYVGRPWYARRNYWMNRPLPPRRPPGPPPRPGPPRPPKPSPPRPPPPPRPQPSRPQPPRPQPKPQPSRPAPSRPGPNNPGGGGDRPRGQTRPAPPQNNPPGAGN